LADKIVLRSNGPQAKIAEIVLHKMQRRRTRHDLHKHPHYYRIRNHLIEFLVDRSRAFGESGAEAGYDPRNPPLVRPGLDPAEAAAATNSPERGGTPTLVAVR